MNTLKLCKRICHLAAIYINYLYFLSFAYINSYAALRLNQIRFHKMPFSSSLNVVTFLNPDLYFCLSYKNGQPRLGLPICSVHYAIFFRLCTFSVPNNIFLMQKCTLGDFSGYQIPPAFTDKTVHLNRALHLPGCDRPPLEDGVFLLPLRGVQRKSAYRRNQRPSSVLAAG